MSRSSHLLEVSAVFHLIFFLAVLVNGMPGERVTATRLDGASVVGELQGWVDHRLVVATDKGLETLPTDELVSVRWPSTPTSADTEEEASSSVELFDGTILPANNIRITGDHLSMTLATTASMDQKPLAIPVKQVSAVRLKTLTPRAAEQWQEIRDRSGQATCCWCSSVAAKAWITLRACSARSRPKRSNSSSMANRSASIATRLRDSFISGAVMMPTPSLAAYFMAAMACERALPRCDSRRMCCISNRWVAWNSTGRWLRLNSPTSQPEKFATSAISSESTVRWTPLVATACRGQPGT